MRLAAHGLSVELPPGWEGQITTAAPPDAEAIAQHRRRTGTAPPLRPTVHVANFPLPAHRGDFGSGAVEAMATDHAFVALVEFGPGEVGTALFGGPLPRRLAPTDFAPRMLQRTLAGQVGFQAFGTESGRSFSLYAVLGRDRDHRDLVRQVNDVLASLVLATR